MTITEQLHEEFRIVRKAYEDSQVSSVRLMHLQTASSTADLYPDDGIPNPKIAENHRFLGQEWLKANNISAAVASFEKAVKKYPSSPELHADLGALYLKQAWSLQKEGGDENQIRALAQKALKEVVKGPPGFITALNNGSAFILLKDTKQARENLENALQSGDQKDPRYGRIYFWLSHLEEMEGHNQEAVEAIKKAVNLIPSGTAHYEEATERRTALIRAALQRDIEIAAPGPDVAPV